MLVYTICMVMSLTLYNHKIFKTYGPQLLTLLEAASDLRWSLSFCLARNSLNGASNFWPIHGIRWMWDTAPAINVSLKAKIMNSFCKGKIHIGHNCTRIIKNVFTIPEVILWIIREIRIIYLYVHLDYCFSYNGGTEECPKWHKEMSTCDTGQIKQGIGNLRIEQLCHWLSGLFFNIPEYI